MAKILVVDDDAEQLNLRRMILERRGHEVALAGSRAGALALLGDFRPRCVLMDLRLPTAGEGLALIREIKAASPEAEIYVLTGWPEDIEGRSERNMASEVFTKPVRMERLLGALARLGVLAAAFLLTSAASAAGPAKFKVSGAGSEVVASISITAPGADWGQKGREGVLARILIDGKPRGHAWVFGEAKGKAVNVFLGRLPVGEHTLTVEPVKSESANLPLETQAVQVTEIPPSDPRYQAVANAPVIIARADTLGRFSDVPMLAYSEESQGALRYTVIFSNEDGGTSTRDLMARWGRTTDIEFVYQVTPATGATLIQAKGHKEIPYSGAYEGKHPSLEVSTLNNMVAPGSAAGKLDFRLLPEPAALTGSRETFMDRHPWTYAVASKELAREGKIRKFGEVLDETISDPRNYLVAELNSAPESAGVQVIVKLKNGGVRYASARGMVESYVTRPGHIRLATELPPGTRIADIAELLLDCVVTPDTKERKGARDGSCGLNSPGRVMLLGPDYAPAQWRAFRAQGRWRNGTLALLELLP
ncbi:MAG: response regulator [Bryobacteraceae bacterium]|nr:response regulator [Bryobacteraceae bacterium]